MHGRAGDRQGGVACLGLSGSAVVPAGGVWVGLVSGVLGGWCVRALTPGW